MSQPFDGRFPVGGFSDDEDEAFDPQEREDESGFEDAVFDDPDEPEGPWSETEERLAVESRRRSVRRREEDRLEDRTAERLRDERRRRLRGRRAQRSGDSRAMG